RGMLGRKPPDLAHLFCRSEHGSVFGQQLRGEWTGTNDLQLDFLIFRAVPMHGTGRMLDVAADRHRDGLRWVEILALAHVPGAFQHYDVTVLSVPMRPREYVGREFHALNVNAGLGWIAIEECKRGRTGTKGALPIDFFRRNAHKAFLVHLRERPN